MELQWLGRGQGPLSIPFCLANEARWSTQFFLFRKKEFQMD